jgi:hypothetical protein
VKKQYIKIVIFLLVFLIPFYFNTAGTSAAGFIPGNIWYSKESLSEGEKIKVYTMIYNNDSRKLSGTVFFFNKTTFLGNKDFVVEGNGLRDVSIDWTVTAGENLIFGQIQNAKFLNSNNTYENASLSGTKTLESKNTISKKINLITETNQEEGVSQGSIINTIVPSVENFIKENTPEIVSEKIEEATNKVEEFRKNVAIISEEKKEEVSREIKNIENSKTASISELKERANEGGKLDAINKETFLKPFKYTELFALSLFSGIFNNKYIFYGLIVLIIFFVLRFVVKKIF